MESIITVTNPEEEASITGEASGLEEATVMFGAEHLVEAYTTITEV